MNDENDDDDKLYSMLYTHERGERFLVVIMGIMFTLVVKLKILRTIL